MGFVCVTGVALVCVCTRGFRISDFMQQSDTIFGCQRAFQIYIFDTGSIPD